MEFCVKCRDHREDLNFAKQYEPNNADVQHLRILLHGPVGAGKSSFINSVDSVLRGKITGRALTDGNMDGRSFTKKVRLLRNTFCSKFYNLPESFVPSHHVKEDPSLFFVLCPARPHKCRPGLLLFALSDLTRQLMAQTTKLLSSWGHTNPSNTRW